MVGVLGYTTNFTTHRTRLFTLFTFPGTKRNC